jgi:carboxymethylenebutenolidase
VPAFVAVPTSPAPWPGVVVVHDALGMTPDLRRQARWLAGAGYLAAAPDLFHGAGRIRCLVRFMRDLSHGTEGPAFADLEAVRRWLAQHPQGTGRVGIVGFCLGGGFALALAPRHGYQASAVNYGGLNDSIWAGLEAACPIVASYGAADSTLKGIGPRLEQALASHGIPHDVKEYLGAGHSFMNDHAPADTPWIFRLMARFSNAGYNAEAESDARQRILAFFDEHLKPRA